ncbi:3-methyl-2-oxobutanoate hydroxymethyltransferase [Rhodobacteraceae bacterium M382]|nr:3-methyl-2-oxobutanoate hydroxymethyltransferase [Rhodobacteraceae bacterium M382]
MQNIYTFGGQPARRNWTVADLRAVKGKQVLTEVSAYTPAEAAAAEAAGIDVIATDCPLTADVRKGASETFVCAAPGLTNYRSDEAVIEAAFEALHDGADSVYCLHSLALIEKLAGYNMPVMGHLGLVPRHSTWIGGLRAYGKTAEEAMELYRGLRQLEDAGAFAVEIECVPTEVLAALSPRTSLITFSIGAGSGGDVQYLFMEDICGENETQPRHAKTYTNLRAMRAEIEAERIRALQAWKADVTAGAYPSPETSISMPAEELDKFHNALEQQG